MITVGDAIFMSILMSDVMLEGSTKQEAALRLLRDGRATMAEIAGLLHTSRQLINHWCRRRGINPVAAREHYLAKLWAKMKP